MDRRVLLINPNRYQHPPVIPIGIEHLASAMEDRGFDTPSVLDLCFSPDPEGDTATMVRDMGPDAICITVRNVDTVLYPGTEYFIPQIASVISVARRHSDAPVIIGGAGIKADPEGIRRALGADLAIVGPGESALPDILGMLPDLPRARVVSGTPAFSTPRRGRHINYPAYLNAGGIAGFQTHTGCSASCPYCIEALTPVAFREPAEVLEDLVCLSDAGASHLHLCDSEFNEDSGYCLSLLRLLSSSAPSFKWSLYMRPAEPCGEMFSLLKRTGAYHITLSVDTLKRPGRYLEDAYRILAMASDSGIKTSVDLLAGFPGESEDTLPETASLLVRAGAREVVANTVLRLYRGLPMAQDIMKDPASSRLVTGDMGMLGPCFFISITPGRAGELLGGLPEARLAGDSKGVNYEGFSS